MNVFGCLTRYTSSLQIYIGKRKASNKRVQREPEETQEVHKILCVSVVYTIITVHSMLNYIIMHTYKS